MSTRVVLVAAFLLMLPTLIVAQEYPNRSSVQVHGLVLTGMIDEFEYGSTNRVRAMYKVTNLTDSPITVMAERTCAAVTRDESWLDPTTQEVTAVPWFIAGCDPQEKVTFPPGETVLTQTEIAAHGLPPRAGLVFESGRVLFLDPWGSPPGFEIVVAYSWNGEVVPVFGKTWGAVKDLYR